MQRVSLVSRDYVPDRWSWASLAPDDVGMNPQGIGDAIQWHRQHSTSSVRNTQDVLGLPDDQRRAESRTQTLDGEDFDDMLGPCRTRGPENGLILRHGYIVAEWGDTRQIDMTYSVTKSYVATMAGIAFDRGLIGDFSDPVVDSVPTDHFSSERNRQITWHHLLQQTSNWDGVLWEKPWWADPQGGQHRGEPLPGPGETYAYNDVRVNLCALALLEVLRRPLPVVLRDDLMDHLGASSTWRWHGYKNSWTVIDGLQVQSVSGGGHWGGGLWISSRDHARFGLLHLRRGLWGERRLLSEVWIDAALRPGDINPSYGYMWWLNADRLLWPSAPESSFAAFGHGRQIIWMSREHDLVVVARWLDPDAIDGFLARIIAAVRG